MFCFNARNTAGGDCQLRGANPAAAARDLENRSGCIAAHQPSIVVSVGNHWMQLLMSGFCPERRVSGPLQDVKRLHGSILQFYAVGALRYLFPLAGAYGRLRIARDGSGSPLPPAPDPALFADRNELEADLAVVLDLE